MNAVLLCVARYRRCAATPTQIALGSDQSSEPTSIRGDPHPVRHSAICSEPAGEVAGASGRRTFKLGPSNLPPAPPGWRKRSHGHHWAGKPLAALDSRRGLAGSTSVVAGKATEKRTHGLHVLRGNH